MKENKIPEFKSIMEEAAFWNRHDVTDYLEEMDLVSGGFVLQVDECKTATAGRK